MTDSTSQAVPSYVTLTSYSALTFSFNFNSASTLTSTLQFQCNGNGGIIIKSNTFSFAITSCIASTCVSGSYAHTGTSIPSSFAAYQNFGTYSSPSSYIYSHPSVSLSQYFNFPSTTCSFSQCQLVSAIGSSTAQGTLNTQFTATISGTGSSQSIVFQMDTATIYSGSLYLSCTVPAATQSGSTCAITQFYVYSSNPITFKVQNCYTSQTPANITLYQNQGGGSATLYIESSTILTTIDSTCSFSCTISNLPAQLTLQSINSTTYQIIANTSSSVTSTQLKFTCQGTQMSYYSNPFYFEITSCIPSICASGYAFSGSSSTFSVNQNSGISNQNTQTAVPISQYFTMPSTSCLFTSCQLVSAIGSSSFLGSVSTMVQSSYNSTTALVQFTINTTTAQSQSLYLACLVPSAPASGTTCALSQFYVYSSNQISFNVLCASTSTTVKASNDIRNVYYITNLPGVLTQLTISNFTSSNPDCPIVKHQLVVSKSSNLSPSYVKITEGSLSFTISNSSMDWLAKIYTFYIYAQAQGGAALNQSVTIQINNDCALDQIILNPVLPGNQEQMTSSYKTVNQLPVLFINTTNQSPISVNINKRIKNIFTSSCPLTQYKISKAVINNQIVDISTFGNYFTLTSNGVFQTLSTAPSSIQNSQVFIQASNNQIWGGDQQQYLIDVTITVIQAQSLTNSSTNSSINNLPSTSSNSLVNSNDSQIEQSQNQSSATSGSGETQSSQSQSYSSSSTSNSNNNNQGGQTSKNQKINNKKVNTRIFSKFNYPFNAIGSKNSNNSQANISEYIQPMPVYFKQISIDKKGIMQIQFNQELQVPDFIKLWTQTKQNYSQKFKINQNQSLESLFNQQIAQKNQSMNQSYQKIVSLQNIMQFEMQVNSLQDQSLLEFKVQLLDWTSKGMTIFLNFISPTLVSSGAQYDIIYIKVLNGSNFTSANSLIPMIEQIDGYNETKIQPQQPSFISIEMIDTIQSNSQSLTIAIIAIQVGSQVLMKANMEMLFKLFLNMQLQQSFPVYQVNFPFKSQLYLDTDRSIVEFDFLKPQSLIKKAGFNLTLLKEDKNTPSNAKRLGMTSSSMLDNMMTYIFILGVFVVLLIFISFLFVFPCMRQKIANFIRDKIKKMKWNGVLRGITLSYLKLSVGLSIQLQSQRNNIKKIDYSALIQQFATLNFLAGYIIFSKLKLYFNSKDFKDPIFQQEFGFLVKGQKIQRINVWEPGKFSNKNVIYIYPSFLMYRLTYSMIPCIFYNQPGIQVQILVMITLSYIYILAKMKTQLSFTEYYVDMFYEFMLLVMQIHMFWFMDGGILNGTPNQVSLPDYMQFQQVADTSFMVCGLSIVLVGLSNFGRYIVQQLINLYNKKKNLYNHQKQLESNQKYTQSEYQIKNNQNKEIVFKKLKKSLKQKKILQQQRENNIIQIQQQQKIFEMQQLSEKVKANFLEIKELQKENIQKYEKSNIIKNKLPLVNASTKLRQLIRNPKVVNDISLMSEIQENRLDELSISEENSQENDVDKIELEKLQAICQKYEQIFNTGQFKMKIDSDCVSRRQLILDKYSVLASDSKQDIEVKLKMLVLDVLSNDHLLKQLKNPLLTFQQFENDVKEYYESKISQINDF